MRLHRYKFSGLLMAMFLLVAIPTSAFSDSEGNGVTPEQVKALYLAQLYNFAGVGKPPHQIRTICYYEQSGVPEEASAGQILAHYVRKKQMPLAVKWLHSTRDFTGCDILYIPESGAASIEDILSRLDAASTLTVSSTDRFIYRGGMIGFKLDNANHVKMEANLINMTARNVTIDARLLAIMEQVVH